MNKRTIDEFRMQAKSVSLPDDVRESVLHAARGGRDSAPGNSSATSSHMHFEHKMAGRALALAACVVVALVITAFSGISGLPWSTGGLGAAGSDATGNSFELKAYAEGIPQGDETLLALDDFNCGSPSGGDDGMWEESHDFNLTCTGDNIASVSYALEGPHVTEPDAYGTNPGILFQNERNDQEGPGIVSYSSTSFSVSYDAQSTSEQGFQRHLVIRFAEPDEMKAIEDQLDALTASSDPSSATADDVRQQESLWSQLEYLSEKQCAQVLSETTFVMTSPSMTERRRQNPMPSPPSATSMRSIPNTLPSCSTSRQRQTKTLTMQPRRNSSRSFLPNGPSCIPSPRSQTSRYELRSTRCLPVGLLRVERPPRDFSAARLIPRLLLRCTSQLRDQEC